MMRAKDINTRRILRKLKRKKAKKVTKSGELQCHDEPLNKMKAF